MEGTLAEDLARVFLFAISIGFHLIQLAELLVYALSDLSVALTPGSAAVSCSIVRL